MALRCELDFSTKPDGPLPATWDTPAGAPVQVTPGSNPLVVKGGKMRLGPVSGWTAFWAWLVTPGAAEYLVTPKLDAPIHTIGAQFRFSSDGHTRAGKTGALVLGIIDGPAIGGPQPNVGVHLAAEPSDITLSSYEAGTFYDYHQSSGAKALDTTYTIEANLNHAAKTVTVTSPWGTITYTNERYDRLSKNYAFFEQYAQNMNTDDYVDIIKVYAYAD